MTTLPAVPDTAVGEVTGRLEMLANGELVVRLRPAGVRDVTGTVVDQPRVHQHFVGCECRLFGSLYYAGPGRAEVGRLDAYWLSPPWWAVTRWLPSRRRIRTQLKRERAQLEAARLLKLELETAGKEVAAQ